MKKPLIFRTLALVIALSCAIGASAVEDVCDFAVDGIFYKIQSDGSSVFVWYEDADSWDPCYTAQEYDIPETVTYNGLTYTITGIGRTAFWNSPNMTRISLPETISLIGENAFNGCLNLTTVFCYAVTPPVMNNAFSGLYKQAELYVPAVSVNAYKTATDWMNFTTIKPIDFLVGDVNGDGMVSIADVTFLIDILLTDTVAPPAADVNGDSNVGIGDVTTLIDLLLTGDTSGLTGNQ